MWKSVYGSRWLPEVSGLVFAALFFLGFYFLNDAFAKNEQGIYATVVEVSGRSMESRSFQPLEWGWQLAFVLGIFLGGLLSAFLGKDWKTEIVPEDAKKNVVMGIVLSLAGGFLVMAGMIIVGNSFLGIWSETFSLSPQSIHAFLFLLILFVEAVVVGTILSFEVKSKINE